MTTTLMVMVGVLWLVVLGLVVAVLALARQVGILFERVSPMGALMIDAGPKVGDLAPRMELPTLAKQTLVLGGTAPRSTLLFFLSPTCPVCKKLLPVLRTVRGAEGGWLDVVLASDGDAGEHQRFVESQKLDAFPYILSTDLGMRYRVSRLPFAVLIGEDGVVRSKGLINSREQLESLFRAKEMAPPLRAEVWKRLGDKAPAYLAQVLVQGMNGVTLDGAFYAGPMPPWGGFSDAQLLVLSTYLLKDFNGITAKSSEAVIAGARKATLNKAQLQALREGR